MNKKSSVARWRALGYAWLMLGMNLSTTDSAAAATVYRWQDRAGGTPHYSTTAPPKDSVQALATPRAVVSPAAVLTPLSPLPTPAIPAAPATPPTQSPLARQSYERLEIVQPQNQQTLPYRDEGVEVKASLAPALQPHDQLILYVDGKKYREVAAAEGKLTVGPIDRGEHQLQAQIVSQDGRILATSQTVVFFLHQHSIE